MRKTDITCSECGAGFRRVELSSRRGIKGEYHCPICGRNLEAFDGSTQIVYRLTDASTRHLKSGLTSAPRFPQTPQVKRSSMSDSRRSSGHGSALTLIEWLQR